jgi:nucleoside-diphosphate-sugar epimerase
VRALITGISGFVGRHVSFQLEAAGFEVWGLDRTAFVGGDAPAGCCARVFIGNVTDSRLLENTLDVAKPTHVFHLAWDFGEPSSTSADSPDQNVSATRALLTTLKRRAYAGRLLIASSSAVYGASGSLPISEETPIHPETPYGTAKVAVEATGQEFANAGVDVVTVRTFNLLGPGMPTRLFAGSLAEQIVAAETGRTTVVKVGRLDPRRDYVDVRDAARAYVALALRRTAQGGAYNVCSGVSRSCRELADLMLASAKVRVTLEHDESRLQAGDVDEQVGSPAKLLEATGWSPEISFDDSVRDILLAARDAMSAG